MIQRTWSNAAARAGTDPCVPTVGNAPYVNSYPVLTDPIRLSYGGPRPTQGVNIPVGQTRTVDVVLASPSGAAAGAWKVRAWDLTDYLGLGPANTILAFDKTSGSSGGVLKLTITVKSYDPSFGGAGFVIESTLDGQDNLTVGAIGQ